MGTRTPHDLALFVYGRLVDNKHRPSIEVLDNLFQIIFLASLKTEEGTPIVCSVAFVDPQNPDPEKPIRIRDPRWRYYSLDKPVEYNIGQLVKISLATDSSASSLCVYPDRKGCMRIWGLFDQQGGYQSLLNHESHGGWAPPGVFQAQILGLGHIIVTSGPAVIAELNGGMLVEHSVNVFEGSLIKNKLIAGFERRFTCIKSVIEESGFRIDPDYKKETMEDWTCLIQRLLLRARSYGHGGAFLITDADYEGRLKIKYGICYDRIPTLFENKIHSEYITHKQQELIGDELDSDPDQVKSWQFLDMLVSDSDTDDAKEAMTGAVGFVAALSRIDGLVLLDKNLVVRGFGCEIIARGDEDCRLFQVNAPNPSKGKKSRLDPTKFGTRHRSMLRYCSEDESAIGFVVSNDGPVRAISRIGKNVYFWDNIQLTLTEPFSDR